MLCGSARRPCVGARLASKEIAGSAQEEGGLRSEDWPVGCRPSLLHRQRAGLRWVEKAEVRALGLLV